MSAPQSSNGDSYETYYELAADSIEIPEKSPAKRESSAPRPTRHLSARGHFYNLLINILDKMQTSTKNDIRRAKERELQRRSIV